MIHTTFEVHIPTTLLQFGFDQNEVQRCMCEWMVFSLFTEGRVSSGKAAQLLGITRVEFLALLREHGIAYINYTSNELADEFASVDALEIHTTV